MDIRVSINRMQMSTVTSPKGTLPEASDTPMVTMEKATGRRMLARRWMGGETWTAVSANANAVATRPTITKVRPWPARIMGTAVNITMTKMANPDPMVRPRQPQQCTLFLRMIVWLANLSQSG